MAVNANNFKDAYIVAEHDDIALSPAFSSGVPALIDMSYNGNSGLLGIYVNNGKF